MSTDELHEQIRSTVSRHLDLDVTRLDPHARLGEDLCIDSLAAVEMIMAVEESLGVTLPDDAIRGVTTYGDFVAVVERAASATKG